MPGKLRLLGWLGFLEQIGNFDNSTFSYYLVTNICCIRYNKISCYIILDSSLQSSVSTKV